MTESYRYRIRNWNTHFERAQSRKVEQLHWVGVPNKQHGMGLIKILSQTDGTAIYGVWILIVGACSQQRAPRLGWLTDDGSALGAPWEIDDLAGKWRRPIAEISRALDVLCSPKVGWMETVADSELVARSQTDPKHRSGEERRGEEREEIHAASPPPKESVKTAATAATLAKRVGGIDSKRVTAAIVDGDVLDVIKAFGGNLEGSRDVEWLRDADGLQIGVVATILAWKRSEQSPIREPSGFRRARAEWRELPKADRGDLTQLLDELGITVPA